MTRWRSATSPATLGRGNVMAVLPSPRLDGQTARGSRRCAHRRRVAVLSDPLGRSTKQVELVNRTLVSSPPGGTSRAGGDVEPAFRAARCPGRRAFVRDREHLRARSQIAQLALKRSNELCVPRIRRCRWIVPGVELIGYGAARAITTRFLVASADLPVESPRSTS
jgi:hypothetical protein